MTASCAGYGAFIRTLLRERICNTTDKGTEFTMFKKLDSVMLHYEDVERELSSPDIASDQKRFRSLMKEQSDLAPIVAAYGEYKACGRRIR